MPVEEVGSTRFQKTKACSSSPLFHLTWSNYPPPQHIIDISGSSMKGTSIFFTSLFERVQNTVEKAPFLSSPKHYKTHQRELRRFLVQGNPQCSYPIQPNSGLLRTRNEMSTTARPPTSNGDTPHLLHLPIQLFDMIMEHVPLTGRLSLSMTCRAARWALQEDQARVSRLTGNARRQFATEMRPLLAPYVRCFRCFQRHLVEPYIVPYSINWSQWGIELCFCTDDFAPTRMGYKLQRHHLLPRFKHQHLGVPRLRHLRNRDDILNIVERKLRPGYRILLARWRYWGP